MLRRVLIVALLVYVALDLSIPTMPGAFGFDPDDSIESVYQTRARAAAEAMIPPASGTATFVLSALPPDSGRQPARSTRPGSAHARAGDLQPPTSRLPPKTRTSPPARD